MINWKKFDHFAIFEFVIIKFELFDSTIDFEF